MKLEKNMLGLPSLLLGLTSIAALVACAGGAPDIQLEKTGSIFALDGDKIISFEASNPSTPVTSKTLQGLDGQLLSIDVRPQLGSVYGLTRAGTLYLIDPATGVAAKVASLTTNALNGSPITLDGTTFDIDFNAPRDRLRLVSDRGQSLSINPDTGVTTTETNIDTASASFSGVAMSYNYPGNCKAELFGIDTLKGKLYRQDSKNQIIEVGSLGVAATAVKGFDIVTDSANVNTAYAVLTVGGAEKLYSINLGTGAATALASLPDSYSAVTVSYAQGERPYMSNEFIGLGNNNIFTFNREDPRAVCSPQAIDGLNADETVHAITVREDGTLWGLSNILRPTALRQLRIFQINKETGLVSNILSVKNADGSFPPALGSGFRMSIAFDPLDPSILRMTSASAANAANRTRLNWAINVNTGVVTINPTIRYLLPSGAVQNSWAAGLAYTKDNLLYYLLTEPTGTAADPELLGVLPAADAATGQANLAIPATVGLRLADGTPVAFTGQTGFDIDRETGIAYVAGSLSAVENDLSKLYSLDLSSGVLTPLPNAEINTIGNERLVDLQLNVY